MMPSHPAFYSVHGGRIERCVSFAASSSPTIFWVFGSQVILRFSADGDVAELADRVAADGLVQRGDRRLARLHRVDEVLGVAGTLDQVYVVGPIFEPSSDFGSASMPPAHANSHPTLGADELGRIAAGGLKASFTPSPN